MIGTPVPLIDPVRVAGGGVWVAGGAGVWLAAAEVLEVLAGTDPAERLGRGLGLALLVLDADELGL